MCLISYEINELFIADVNHNNTFSFSYFNGH